jgi:hypothetical protein
MRLGHCTTTMGIHSPLCDRDGRYCSLESQHRGECKPHGRAPLTDEQKAERQWMERAEEGLLG